MGVRGERARAGVCGGAVGGVRAVGVRGETGAVGGEHARLVCGGARAGGARRGACGGSARTGGVRGEVGGRVRGEGAGGVLVSLQRFWVS